MILLSIFTNPISIITYWILHSLSYYFILKKMNLRSWTAVIPVLAEREFSTVLFSRIRQFYRPFIISLIFLAGALYLGTGEKMGWMFMIVASIVYWVFQLRLYWRLAKSFGKGIPFRLGMFVFDELFLLILAFGKAKYEPLNLKYIKDYPLLYRIFYYIVFGALSAAEVAALAYIVGFISFRTTPPVPLVLHQLNEVEQATASITGNNEVVLREETMGDAYASRSAITPSRAHFFPDHSEDKNAVVLVYVVGSNLEDKGGLASANIRQMIDATKKGDGLTFVMQAGGSKRWFTSGIQDNTYGRYSIHGGKITKEMDLPSDLCMSESSSLQDFLLWAKDAYPDQRTMLVLWDHGGGVASGYGHDDLNKRTTGGSETMQVFELIDAIKNSGIRFDLIGFDACLMQYIEIASAMEPCTDYYLASEEVEGGYGWYYTSAFGKLAENPAIATEEFGKEIISCFDQYNTALHDGKADTTSTLSLVDTTLAKPAYEKLCGLFETADEKMREDSSIYADLAGAGMNAYNFNQNIQIDLIDYLQNLQGADYDDTVMADAEIEEIINAIKNCVVIRNKNSAAGINGMAFAFPYKAIFLYSDTSKNLGALSLNTQQKTFNDFFSIMAAQKKKASDSGLPSNPVINPSSSSDDPLVDFANNSDFTQEDWYVSGFEDYDNTDVLVDIPLKEAETGYEIDLPEKVWNIIADCKTAVYQLNNSNNGEQTMIYLGSDYIGESDANGHPIINMDGIWTTINGQVICYSADQIKGDEKSAVFTGTTRARLNNKENITLYIEWDPIPENSDEERTGRVIGYSEDIDSLLSIFIEFKGLHSLEAGDSIQFIFDKYDAEGNFISSEPAGKTIYIKDENSLKVEDRQLDSCDIRFYGVLTDVYQRNMTTEAVEMHLGN